MNYHVGPYADPLRNAPHFPMASMTKPVNCLKYVHKLIAMIGNLYLDIKNALQKKLVSNKTFEDFFIMLIGIMSDQRPAKQYVDKRNN